jgi:hypothetical protein
VRYVCEVLFDTSSLSHSMRVRSTPGRTLGRPPLSVRRLKVELKASCTSSSRPHTLVASGQAGRHHLSGDSRLSLNLEASYAISLRHNTLVASGLIH